MQVLTVIVASGIHLARSLPWEIAPFKLVINKVGAATTTNKGVLVFEKWKQN